MLVGAAIARRAPSARVGACWLRRALPKPGHFRALATIPSAPVQKREEQEEQKSVSGKGRGYTCVFMNAAACWCGAHSFFFSSAASASGSGSGTGSGSGSAEEPGTLMPNLACMKSCAQAEPKPSTLGNQTIGSCSTRRPNAVHVLQLANAAAGEGP